MLAGTAALPVLVEALAVRDPMTLANTVLQLQFACGRPEVRALLADLRADRRDSRPALAWDWLATPALQFAIAHTAARCEPAAREDVLPLLRAGLGEADPFAQAQAAVALAFLGDDSDVPALARLARDGAPYAAEAAIKALALLGGAAARAALVELRERHAGDERRRTLLRQVMAERWEEFRRRW